MLISSARSATYFVYLVYFMGFVPSEEGPYCHASHRSTCIAAPEFIFCYRAPSPSARDKGSKSVVWPSVPQRRWFVLTALKRTIRPFRLFFSAEDPFLCAPDPAMGVQTFQHELGGGNEHLRRLFGFYSHGGQLFRESLDVFEAVQHFLSAGGVGKLDLAAQFKPLHHLLHVQVFE